MSRVAAGHFRRRRDAPLILRESTSQFRGPSPDLARPGPLRLPRMPIARISSAWTISLGIGQIAADDSAEQSASLIRSSRD